MRILGIDPGIATVGFGVVDTAAGKQHYSEEQCRPFHSFSHAVPSPIPK